MENKPAPWKLKGRGLLLSYSFDKEWLLNHGYIPPHLHDKFVGGLSSVMLVKYEDSDVGPYNELLFIPGLFKIEGKIRMMVTKIYVDSEASVHNGRNNWGIPKELAKITWDEQQKTVVFNCTKGDRTILFAEFKKPSIKFPVFASLNPFNFYQELEGRSYTFKPLGRGKGGICRVKKVASDGFHFPELWEGKKISNFYVSSFDMIFPKAQ